MVFQHLFQEVFKGSQVCTFYYASLIFLQKLPNKTQNSGPKTVLCRHKINNSQWSLLGVHYVILKKKKMRKNIIWWNLKQVIYKMCPGWGGRNNSPISVGRNTQKLPLHLLCREMYFYKNSLFFLTKIPNSIWLYYWIAWYSPTYPTNSYST